MTFLNDRLYVPRIRGWFAWVAAAALLASPSACTPRTDDTKLVWVESSADALDVMSRARGAFGINGTPRSVWLDPRSEAEYAQGHIPGAISLPFPRVEGEHEVVLKEVDVVVVYDSDFDDTLARAVAKKLISRGHKEVYILRGGLKSWTRDGNTVETGPPKPKTRPDDDE